MWGRSVYKIKSHSIFTMCIFYNHPYTCRYLWINLPCAVRKAELILCEPSLCLKSTKNTDDKRGKRRFGRNILQWSKNDIKSKKSTNGDYFRWKIIPDEAETFSLHPWEMQTNNKYIDSVNWKVSGLKDKVKQRSFCTQKMNFKVQNEVWGVVV